MAVEWLAGKRARGTSSERPKIDFQDNFDENTSWTQAGSPNTEIVHDHTTDDRIEFTNQRDSFLYKSMGITLSDTFVIQFTHSLTSNPTVGSRYMLFEVTAGTSEPRSSSQDALGVIVGGASQNLYQLAYKDGAGSWTQSATTEDILQSETKYLRLIRDGTNWTIKVYTNSDYSDTPYSFTTSIPSTVTGLSYAMFGGESGEVNSWTCWVDDLKVYDGVTSVPNTNLQDGTIFEESDTNKAYIWNATTKTWTQL